MKLSTNIPETMIPGSYSEFNYYAGPNGLPVNVQKVLLVGAGTGVLPVNSPMEVYSEADATTLTGAGSVLHSMYLAAKEAWKYAQITLVRHAEPVGSAAHYTVTLSGSATKSGVARLRIGSTFVSAAVAIGATPTEVAAALVLAVNAKTFLPVTATSSGAVLTLTAKNIGAYISDAGGVSIDGVMVNTDMTLDVELATAGVGTVDLEDVLKAAFPARYHLIGVSVSDSANLILLRTHLENAASPLEQRGQRGIAVKQGTLSAVKALVTSLNHERLNVGAVKELSNPVWEISAGMCAVFASNSKPNKPMNGLPIVGLDIPAVAARWSGEEEDALLMAGVIPLAETDGELCLVRAVTTKTNVDGVRFEKLVDTGVIASMDYTRDSLKAMQTVKYKNAVIHEFLADAINEDNFAVCKELEKDNIHRYVDDHKDQFITQESPDVPGRVLCRVPAGIVPGLNQIYNTIDLYLN